MRTLSTPEVALLVGIHRVTLERWLAAGVIASPRRLQVGGKIIRLWTVRDVERVRRHKAKHYRKGRGPKKKPK